MVMMGMLHRNHSIPAYSIITSLFTPLANGEFKLNQFISLLLPFPSKNANTLKTPQSVNSMDGTASVSDPPAA